MKSPPAPNGTQPLRVFRCVSGVAALFAYFTAFSPWGSELESGSRLSAAPVGGVARGQERRAGWWLPRRVTAARRGAAFPFSKGRWTGRRLDV